MKKSRVAKTILIFLAAAIAAATLGTSSLAAAGAGAKKESCISPEMARLKADMQKAWIDHTIWTRSYIVSAMTNRPDLQDVLERLLRNQQDIGKLFKPYYGEAAGNRLADLLRKHIVIAGDIVEAAKAGNQQEVDRLQKLWSENAGEIAGFLSGLNPNWDRKTLQQMLQTHLDLITEIVIQCLRGNWKADIAATDKNEIHMIRLADFLTDGIVKQFPEKF